MKKLICILLIALCLCAALPAGADSTVEYTLTVNGGETDAGTCYNSDGALCLELLPVAEALGYSVDRSELSEGDVCRVVYTLTPGQDSGDAATFELMVAYSIENGQPTAVAVSKNQMLLPLKQSMTLVDEEPYLPTEFFETGMCVSFTLDEATQTLDMSTISYFE